MQPGDFNLHHVWPKAHFGGGLLGKVLATHERCNTRWADKLPTGCQIIFLGVVNAKIERMKERIDGLR
jgi:hypothetical protein